VRACACSCMCELNERICILNLNMCAWCLCVFPADSGGHAGLAWGGKFELQAVAHTLTLSRVGHEYVAGSFVVAALRGDSGTSLEEVNNKLQTAIRYARTCSTNTPHDEEHDHSEEHHEEEHAEGEEVSDHEEHDMHEVPHAEHGFGHGSTDDVDVSSHTAKCLVGGVIHSGDTLDMPGVIAEEAVDVSTFEIDVDESSSISIVKLHVAERGTYFLASERPISDFAESGGPHYLKTFDGTDVLPSDVHDSNCVEDGVLTSEIWGYSIVGSLFGGMASLFGALIMAPFVQPSVGALSGQGAVPTASSLAADVLIALCILHIIPEASALAGLDWRLTTSISGGFLLGLAMKHGLALLGFGPLHSHGRDSGETAGIPQLETAVEDDQVVPFGNAIVDEESMKEAAKSQPASGAIDWGTVLNIVIGDAIHNLFDGVAIGTAFSVCGSLGWVVSASVLVHELPQELSDFAILIKSGLPIWKAVTANLISSSSSFIGVIAALLIGSSIGTGLNETMGLMLAFSDGVLLFVGIQLLQDIGRVTKLCQAAICWVLLISGFCIIGVLTLWHVHCHSSCDSAGGGSAAEDHSGHNH